MQMSNRGDKLLPFNDIENRRVLSLAVRVRLPLVSEREIIIAY